MCEFEFIVENQEEFTENKAGHILNLMDEYLKYLSLKMNREKLIFNFEKRDLEFIGNSVHTAEYLAFGKALLARLDLKVKVYITKLLSVYIVY